MQREIDGRAFQLPRIAPTYRPSDESYWADESGAIQTSQPRHKTPASDDTSMFQSKRGRTRMFTGKRGARPALTTVPTLFDACMSVVCDNIDAIEDTGDIPFEILKKALERATPAQLNYIESRNPYLAEDSGELWERHGRREFAASVGEMDDDESWRDFFLRQTAAREERLKRVAAKVSAHTKKTGQPTRLAKTMVEAKAPRDVRRKQQRNGLSFSASRQILPTSEAIVQARRQLDSQTAGSSKGDLRGSAIYRPTALSAPSSSSKLNRKPAKAPMMAKIARQLAIKKR